MLHYLLKKQIVIKKYFEFWKYSNKDEVAALAEGEQEEVTLIKKVTRVFDYIEDIENFGEVMDKVQRTKLSKEELDGVYITSTDMLDILNKIKNNEVMPREIEANLREIKRQARDEKTLLEDVLIFLEGLHKIVLKFLQLLIKNIVNCQKIGLIFQIFLKIQNHWV